MSFSEIKKSINSNLNKPLNELLAEGVVDCVKSVQSGVIWANTKATTYVKAGTNRLTTDSINSIVYNYFFDVTLSQIDMSKSTFCINAFKPSNTQFFGQLINDHTLRIYVLQGNYTGQSYQQPSAMAWQVIEFY